MIRFDSNFNAWISGRNIDDQGMPTTNLENDDKVCLCPDCFFAALHCQGTNIAEVRTRLINKKKGQ